MTKYRSASHSTSASAAIEAASVWTRRIWEAWCCTRESAEPDTALRVSAVDPLRESPVRLIVDVLLREGDVLGARHTYHHYAALLRTELDLVPSSELRALVR